MAGQWYAQTLPVVLYTSIDRLDGSMQSDGITGQTRRSGIFDVDLYVAAYTV